MGDLADKVLGNLPPKPDKPKVPPRNVPAKQLNYVPRRGRGADDYSDLEKAQKDNPDKPFYKSHWR